MIEINSNINLKADKVITQIDERKKFRHWTYLIATCAIIIAFFMYGGEFLKGLADLIRALKGK